MSKIQKFKKIEASDEVIKFQIGGAEFILVPKEFGFGLWAPGDTLAVAASEQDKLKVSSNSLLLKMFEKMKIGEKNENNNTINN